MGQTGFGQHFQRAGETVILEAGEDQQATECQQVDVGLGFQVAPHAQRFAGQFDIQRIVIRGAEDPGVSVRTATDVARFELFDSHDVDTATREVIERRGPHGTQADHHAVAGLSRCRDGWSP